MKKSLEAFMNNMIDYAGLFPPADLPLEEAIENYAQYVAGSNAWMLSRFIIPARRLSDLSAYAGDYFSAKTPFPFSVLGKGTDTLSEFSSEIDAVLEHCTEFCDTYPNQVATDMLEMKLPKEAALSNDVELLQKLMDDTALQLSQSEETPSMIFYEGVLDATWRKNVEAILRALALHNQQLLKTQNYQYAAFKLRCGGVEPEHFPSVEQVAFVLTKAREHNVAVKGTAGLHHPVRHYAESVQTKMHGFFNVFGGAMLGYAHDLNASELENILNEEDAEQFSFTDENFSWKEYSISTEEIAALRETALLSYGSCSFEEPIEDLQKLNLF